MEIVSAGEPLPEWAQDMLDRALALSKDRVDADQAVVAAVANDLVATLGWTREQAEEVAGRTAEAQARLDSSEDFALAVTEDVQQWLHDIFLDSTWPTCPEHRQHPLWLNDDDPPMWTCHTTGRTYCRLGELVDVVVTSAADAEKNRERLAAENRATDARLKQFKEIIDRRRRS